MKKYLIWAFSSIGSSLLAIGLVVPAVAFAGAYLYVDSSTGYVGLGNTTPQAQLDVSGAMYSRLVAATPSSIDWNEGNVQTLTLSSSPTLTFINGQAGGVYNMIVNQDSTGSRTITWPASVKWPGGTTPTLSSAASSTDMFSFVFDGSSYLGNATLDYGGSSAPIAFDAAAGAKDNSGAVTSLTWSHTNTGTNLTLVVICSITQSTGGAVTYTGATYNGSAMATSSGSISTVTGAGGTSKISTIIYTASGPATGAHSVVVKTSNVLDSNKQFACVSQSYTGTQQSAQPDSVGTNQSAGSGATNFSVSDTVINSGAWLVGGASEDQGDIAAGSAGTNTVYRGVAQYNLVGADSNSTQSSGSHSLNWGRAGATGNLVGSVVALIPAP